MALDHLPLSEVLDGLISEFQRHGSVPKITLAADNLAARYNDAVNITIYRCVQEGVTNALRHARASSLEIVLREVPVDGRMLGSGNSQALLHLTISDDGTGTSPSDGRGLGLTGMQERVRALGGTVSIGPNSKGEGTCLTVRIPVENSRAQILNDGLQG
jgi:two-component system sensor histidine kinase UhpB